MGRIVDVALWQRGIQNGDDQEPGPVCYLFEASVSAFSALLHILAADSSQFESESYQQLRNEFLKFYMWNEGFSTRTGDLDHILASSKNLKGTVLGLMVQWVKAVSKIPEVKSEYNWSSAFAEVTELQIRAHKVDQIAKATMLDLKLQCSVFDNLDAGDESDSGSDFESSLNDITFEDIVEDLGIYMDSLADLSSSLDHPAKDNILIEDLNTSLVEEYANVPEPARPFVFIIRDRFPSLETGIVKRLGEANWQRRERLRMKFESAPGMDETSSTVNGSSILDAIIVDPRRNPSISLTRTVQSTAIASDFSDPSLFDSMSISVPRARRVRPPESDTSFATSMAEGLDQGQRRIPNLPEQHEYGSPFQCQICGDVQTGIRNRRDWKKHVNRDLKPYICLFPGCEMGLRTFQSRREWRSHEFQVHRMNIEWRCSLCKKTFETQEVLRRHMIAVHENEITTSQVEEVISTSKHLVPCTVATQLCPFCLTAPSETQAGFASHVGKHQQEIALAALPWLGDTSDDDKTENSESSDNDNVTSEHRDEDLANPKQQASPQHQDGKYARSPAQKNAFLHAHNPKHLELLNTLTKLQALNVESNFDLPQIVVCGSQSSEKSSVIEAITEIPFLRSEYTRTCFVTKVTLRPHPRELVEVKIEQADPTSSRKSVPQFPPITDLRNLSSELQEQFKKAADAILGNQQQTQFSRDILSITISGPDRPILQILDLPGLILNDAYSVENPELVRHIVESEMGKQHSTILAVVAAHTDFKEQEILSLCKKYDSKGERTVRIITRPDTAEKSQAETYVAIAQGLRKDEVHIQHDWHVLRNRSSEDLKKNTSIEERNAAEERFLREEPWAQLGAENLGVVTLRTRLSKILPDAASREFPKLIAKTEAQLKELAAERKSLGGDNRTEEEIRHIFSVAAENLKKRTSSSVKGDYVYDTSHFDPSHPIFLRSRIVEQNELFRDRILTEGHAYSTQLEPSDINPDADLRSTAEGSRVSAMEKLEPSSKTSEEEIQEGKKLLDEKRGMEPPGTFSPQRINDFFWKQSEPWNQIAEEHIGKVFEHCELYFKHATLMAFAPDPLRSAKPTFGNHQVVAERVFKLICSKLEGMKEYAKRELSQIEIDRTETQLNFLPKYLAEYRQQRNTRDANRTTDAFVKDAVLQNKDLKQPIPELNPNTIAEGQRRHTQDDRTEEEAEDFLNAARLQYKIARDCYITNILTQVVERHFMRGLSRLIPEVWKLDDKIFSELVEEDKDLKQRKEDLKRKSEVLQKCHDILEKHRWR